MTRPRILLVSLLVAAACSRPASDERPNVVLIFVDDLGYGDIGPFGSKNRTPNLDRMAAEGLKLTQFYVSAVNCTPSRAALMTGAYADRIGMDGPVVFPADPRGLHPDEITLAELFKSRGYATACIGKWHLGDQPEFLPSRQGFDEYFGLPYSNDMWTGHPAREMPPLPVLRGDEPAAWISDGVDQALVTEAYDAEAVDFIERHRDRPFFLYLPHTFVHLPRWVRAERLAAAGGDVNRATVEEIDASVGRVLDALRANGLAEKTLVLFTSDNGGARGMDMGPLRGGKSDVKYEGAMRAATLVWQPGRVPAGAASDEIAATVDLFPSFARLIGAEIPADRTLDGRDALDVLLGEPGARSPHDVLYYEYDGIRRGDWKMVVHADGRAELFDLAADPGERNDLASERPEIAAELRQLLVEHEARVKADRRPAGMVAEPRPLLPDAAGVPTLKEYLKLGEVVASNGETELRR